MKVANKLTNFFDKKIVEKNQNVLIFDLHNLIYRTLHIANFQVPEDIEFKYWKHIFMNSILTSIKRFEPNRVILAVDGKKTWRKDIFPGYKEKRKAGRDKSTVDFKKFFPIMNDFISDMKSVFTNIYSIKVENAEADDIIAVIVMNELKTNNVTIISNDSDLKQLLKYKNVKIWNPIKKKFESSININTELEIKIIAGDNSDNIPGIKPRCGVKTAEKIIREGLDKHLNDDEIIKNYNRNKKLIDFNFIPKNIKDSILKEYKNYNKQKVNGRKVWEFFLKNKMKKHAEDLQQNMPFLKSLK